MSERCNRIRGEIIVSSKTDFIPVDIEKGKSFIKDYLLKKGVNGREDIKFGHSMKPEFIQESVELSLANLGLETVDIYYIHNPETQLERISNEEFYEDLTNAF